jgi:hypothetical protein
MINVLIVLLISGGCATTKKAISHEEAVEIFSGTWVNLDNPITYSDYGDPTKSEEEQAAWFHFQKFVLTTNGLFECYHAADDPVSFAPGKYTMKESWVDSKGNTYCQIMCQLRSGSRLYMLIKLEETNRVMEQNFFYGGQYKYPEKIVRHDIYVDDDYTTTEMSMYYNIFYRQE